MIITFSDLQIACVTLRNALCALTASPGQMSFLQGHPMRQAECGSHSAGARKPSLFGVDILRYVRKRGCSPAHYDRARMRVASCALLMSPQLAGYKISCSDDIAYTINNRALYYLCLHIYTHHTPYSLTSTFLMIIQKHQIAPKNMYIMVFSSILQPP